MNGASQSAISILTTTTASYCNECAPDLGAYERLFTPKPIQARVYLYNTDSLNFGQEIVAEGGEQVILTPGKYIAAFQPLSIYDVTNYLSTIGIPVQGVSTQIQANTKIVEIPENTLKININYHQYCSWQLDSNIPPPP